MIRILLLVFTFFVLASFSSDKLPKEFTDLLSEAKLDFIQPVGLVKTKCIANKQMNYEYALKYPKQNAEVRYSIRPGKDRPSVALFQSTLLNIGIDGPSSGNLPKISYFDSTAVKKEFNADWGATAFVNLGKQFGQDYKYCIAVTIHRNDNGDAYFFYVAEDKKGLDSLMNKAFHSLKFK